MKNEYTDELTEYFSRIDAAQKPKFLQSIVVYTAVMGGYDQLIDPLIVEGNVSYICFTDSLVLQSTTWTIIHVDGHYRDPRRTAKIYKMYPHILFPQATISIWVDGSCKIVGRLTDFIENYFPIGCDFMCFAHYKRTTVSEERMACKRQSKDDIELIDQQEFYYSSQNFPDSTPLIAGGVLVRRHMNSDIIHFNESWHFEVDKFSVRDLLSFNYVAWRHRLKYTLIPLSLIDNGFFSWLPHKKLIFYDRNGNRKFSFRALVDSVYSKIIYRIRFNNFQ